MLSIYERYEHSMYISHIRTYSYLGRIVDLDGNVTHPDDTLISQNLTLSSILKQEEQLQSIACQTFNTV